MEEAPKASGEGNGPTTADGGRRPHVYLIHGWPNSAAILAPYAEYLEQQGFTCTNCALPKFPQPRAGEPGSGGPVLGKRGSMDSCVHALKAKIDEDFGDIETAGDSNQPCVYLLGHDWGAVVIYLYAQTFPNDKRIAGLITFSVSPMKRCPNPCAVFFFAAYQFTLAMIYLLGRVICCSLLAAACNRCMASCLGAKRYAKVEGDPLIYPSDMNWPYANEFGDTIRSCLGCGTSCLGGKNIVWKFISFSPGKVPLLFVYETSPPCHKQFTDQKWLRLMKKAGEKSLTQAVGMSQPDADHWVVYTHAKELAPRLSEWIHKVEASPRVN